MVLVALSHTHGPIHEGAGPVGIGSQRAPQTVGFDICFIHHKESQAVAQFVPTGRVWIMTGTHSVDAGFLHQADILQHTFLRHHASQ